MHKARCLLKSASPYSQSRPFNSKKPRDETHEAFENRVWKERLHVDEDGIIFIPAMAFKNALGEAAKYKSIQIPGKGKSTYTKHFNSGVMVIENLPIGIHIDDIECEPLFVPSDGQSGSGKRVWKNFPLIRKWSGVVEFLIFDEIIDEAVFEQHLIDCGQFIGLGRFRPINRGTYGRFAVEKVDWS